MEARTREKIVRAQWRVGRGGRVEGGSKDIKKLREREKACKKQAERVSFINLEYWEKSTAAEEGY